MKEPRISIDHAESTTAEGQEALARFQRNHKALNNLVRQLALVPAAVDLQNALSQLPGEITSLPARVVEAARLRVIAVCECHYCTGWHRRYAEQAGYSIEDIAAIVDLAQPAPGCLPQEVRLAVQVAHELSTSALSDATFAAAKAQWGEIGALELIVMCAAQNATSRIGAALQTPFEPAYERMMARKIAAQGT